MRPTSIFISYRRDDSAGYARAVYDELARRFGAERVFMDVDDIPAGESFADVIQRAVGESALLLVLIGRRWLGEREGQPARITEPGDFVRLEVAAALAKRMRVIPLLLDGMQMPDAARLPDDLRALAGRNALELDNSRFAADIERVAAAVREALGDPAAMPAAREPARWRVGAGALLAIGVAGALYWSAQRPTAVSPAADRASATPTTSAAARAAVNGEWQSALEYDWPNARYTERFRFDGAGRELHGSASFLGVPRGVLEGAVEADALHFVTRTQEAGGGELTHRYLGRLAGDELRFVMQTEGGSSAHVPVAFVAKRVAGNP